MELTVKRVHVALTKEETRMLTELKDKLGETQSNILKHGLTAYYIAKIGNQLIDGRLRDNEQLNN